MADADELEFRKRIHDELDIAIESVDELRDKLTGWGFSPALDRRVNHLIAESGYWVSPSGKEGKETANVRPNSDGKFDLAKAQEGVRDLDFCIRLGRRMLVQENEDENMDVVSLATRLCLAAKKSLEKHADFRDAVQEMGDYETRGWNHPNASKRAGLLRILYLYLAARARYQDDIEAHAGGKQYDMPTESLHDRINQFQDAAAAYVQTPPAYSQWLTRQILESLVEPYVFLLVRNANRVFPPNRIGANRKEPWCIYIPLCMSVLMFLLSTVAVIGCFVLFPPIVGYAALGVCGMVYAKRYVEAREFKKERLRWTRLAQKTSEIHSEVKSGAYNVGEVIRRFREIEADDLRLPSIFVSVIQLPEVKSNN